MGPLIGLVACTEEPFYARGTLHPGPLTWRGVKAISCLAVIKNCYAIQFTHSSRLLLSIQFVGGIHFNTSSSCITGDPKTDLVFFLLFILRKWVFAFLRQIGRQTLFSLFDDLDDVSIVAKMDFDLQGQRVRNLLCHYNFFWTHMTEMSQQLASSVVSCQSHHKKIPRCL